jgi:tetratricopeptide (TPR) repeat protein
LALAHKGRLEDAKEELESLKKIAPEMAKLPTTPAGPENAAKIPQIMAQMMEAHLALAGNDRVTAIEHLKQAVAIEDTMDYNEPPDWFMPARETLGGTLLRAGKAADAEQVFRRDLEVNARSPRSLFGLAESLKAQHKDHDAEWVQRAFEEAWKDADAKLSVEEL